MYLYIHVHIYVYVYVYVCVCFFYYYLSMLHYNWVILHANIHNWFVLVYRRRRGKPVLGYPFTVCLWTLLSFPGQYTLHSFWPICYEHYYSCSKSVELIKFKNGPWYMSMYMYIYVCIYSICVYICIYIFIYIQSDQKVSVNLMITIQKPGAQRPFDHPVYLYVNCLLHIGTSCSRVHLAAFRI
jgi:hypothetical protein